MGFNKDRFDKITAKKCGRKPRKGQVAQYKKCVETIADAMRSKIKGNIRAEVSNAPVSAQVSVSSPNGISNIATTVVSEKNGWLNMKAVGFTFSEKTLRVKITQAKNQRYTINCMKGSLSKKVVGVKPRCPKGYKSL